MHGRMLRRSRTNVFTQRWCNARANASALRIGRSSTLPKKSSDPVIIPGTPDRMPPTQGFRPRRRRRHANAGVAMRSRATPAAVNATATATMREFETTLLRGDASALDALCFPLAAAVARGDLHPALQSPAAAAALAGEPQPSQITAYEKYTAGVALLLAFVRDNWGGPRVSTHDPYDGDEEAALRLARDGEDVAVAVRSARYIAAARAILIDGLPALLEAGATLAPWWSARVALAHHAVLSAPTPTLQAEVFSLFGRFMGTDAANSRFLFGDVVPRRRSSTSAQEDEDDADDWNIPAMDGFADEEDDFQCILPTEGEQIQEGEIPLAVLAHIELALAQRAFYDAEGAALSIGRATNIAGINLSISGELGMRTKFQSKATAQLIARAYQLSTLDADDVLREAFTGLATVFPHCHANANRDDLSQQVPLPKNIPVNDSDVLGYIKLAEPGAHEEGEDKANIEHGAEIDNLTPLDQALVLAHAAIVRARNAAHLLTDQQMAPYVNLVLKNENSIYGTSSLVQIKALVLRVSFESDRGRYLERCMTQMETVASFLDDGLESLSEQVRNLAVAERAYLTFATAVPPYWELKKQLAVSLGNIGLVKAAMEIFKELGFWNELVDCHRLVGNLGAAETLVKSQLTFLDDAVAAATKTVEEASPETAGGAESRLKRAKLSRDTRRPRLLCVLGDVLRDTTCFERAWNESGKRYTRAKRALGRLAIDGAQWEEAVAHFRDALAINPLFPDVWFSYGCAAMEIGDAKTAAEAFTHVIRQTPEYGEGWNNLGNALCELGRKREALKALSEAARIMRDTWRVWDNVLLLATEVKSTVDILRAIERLLEIRGRDAVFERPLCFAVEDVIRVATSADKDERQEAGPLCRRLLKVLGKATSIVSTNASVWAAYSELHELAPQAGGAQKAFDCRLKQVRVLVAKAEWNKEKAELRRMALASIALCRLATKVGDRIAFRAAQMHMESILEQTKADFREDPAFVSISEAHADLEAAWRKSGIDGSNG